MDTIRVKPAHGKMVRDPVSYQLLASEGEDKPADQFWLRRVRDGDVEVIEPEPEAEPDSEGEV